MESETILNELTCDVFRTRLKSGNLETSEKKGKLIGRLFEHLKSTAENSVTDTVEPILKLSTGSVDELGKMLGLTDATVEQLKTVGVKQIEQLQSLDMHDIKEAVALLWSRVLLKNYLWPKEKIGATAVYNPTPLLVNQSTRSENFAHSAGQKEVSETVYRDPVGNVNHRQLTSSVVGECDVN